uniref:Uncharacterized protein n=1 Tax=Rhizophora mucronata TaxID=61149 RepID=A0A2P2IY83_RHIMU
MDICFGSHNFYLLKVKACNLFFDFAGQNVICYYYY